MLVLAASLMTATGGEASADGDVAKARPWGGGVGAAGYAALTGPARTGVAAVAVVYPGAWAGRLGARFEARTIGDDEAFDRGLFTAGLSYEAAAARPRLSLALHGEVGALAPAARVAAGGGVELQLWLIGPIALALDSTAHVIVDGLDSELVLAGSLGLRLAR